MISLIFNKGNERNVENTDLFGSNADLYEEWFKNNPFIFQSELAAIKQLLPKTGTGIEIGIGTGIFAQELGIQFGIEPSLPMRLKAMERGLQVVEGFAENLPLSAESRDFAVMITVDCFLTDVLQAFKEVARILSPGGCFVIAFIDRATPLGAIYEQKRHDSPFYKQAHFHSADEIRQYLTAAGFVISDERQTVFSFENGIHEVRRGTGEGVFGVIRAEKTLHCS